MNHKKIEEALLELRKGNLIIVADDESREAEGDLVGIANLVSPETINFMTKFARGLICAPISLQRAKQLQLTEMVQKNTDPFGTAFTISVDYETTVTGISAYDRAKTIKALGQTTTKATMFHQPGHIFPLIGKEGGVLKRRGHTEAALDLAKLTNQSEAAYICEILNEDGTMARLEQLKVLAHSWQMPLITVEELKQYLEEQRPTVQLPTAYGDFELTLFEDSAGEEHLLLTKGDLRKSEEPLLVRIHSECLTGDVFGSHRCDCGDQLHEAMRMISERGTGAILYLRQEGRGIGLKNKLLAYQLQETGIDTYDANLALGFEPDERTYQFAVEMLKKTGIQRIELLTNNPEKVTQLMEQGIEVVKRVPLEIPPEKENYTYLQTKKTRFHHLLSI
ncbi:GTP cyclohydrolase II [Enterococcus thailandicus]|uniref:GTP cyclohydrolase II n=1 Tax=Enterococcus TaxID=1350 RepID=UPI000BAF4C42|nr:GTP cyclohydrolase II [Enterococcus thailandicus]ASZ06637.1 bifunctional 3,4-dihydroxy-2-butanone-4-phosphate synthase/GTP cyclohydrolase II [Enterococcus thailandicus]MDK4351867.1 GTP cyclohydrolase II [Enterococcus thailandicus]MDT2733984.1 GTP cyclohydrolase II [Enterococcus thailandicus]MDT2751556.1 GTP cyclohydrolase II [Enterococcus thailandicus]MDT2776336.1 GTP cyclohydrolase II [Enterococcus thailandicus]